MVYFIFKPINKLHTINYITPLKRFQVKLVSSLCDKSNTVTILATLVLLQYMHGHHVGIKLLYACHRSFLNGKMWKKLTL